MLLNKWIPYICFTLLLPLYTCFMLTLVDAIDRSLSLYPKFDTFDTSEFSLFRNTFGYARVHCLCKMSSLLITFNINNSLTDDNCF